MAADHFIGRERRFEQRRKTNDRRAAIRFELDKSPRRSGKDRRTHGKSVWEGRAGF